MTAGSLYRNIAKSLAPLREGTAEGAIASEGWQDKRDSLRPCPAVGLLLLVSTFAQAVNPTRSLSIVAYACANTPIRTSSAFRNVS